MPKKMKRAKFEKFAKQIAEDLTFDISTLEDFAKKLPSLKHFWVAKLIQEKILLRDLEEEKKELEQQVFNSLGADMVRKVTRKSLAESDPKVMELSDQIDESRLIVEYLEKVERIFSQTGYDLKNYIDAKKIEEN